MNIWEVPWLELSIIAALSGALLSLLIRDVTRSFVCGVCTTATVLLFTSLAWAGFEFHGISVPSRTLPGRTLQAVDGLSAPLILMTALLYFLTTLATGRTKWRRFSVSWSLASEAIQIAVFGCCDPWHLVTLLSIGTLPPLIILVKRGKPIRIFLIHMSLFVGLLVFGQAAIVSFTRENAPVWATLPLLAAVLIRCGTFPVHCWITDWFENSSFGNALLFVAPLTGVYAAIRLVLPIAPEWALQAIGLVSLLTAAYASCMATVQREPRRFFAYLFLSQASLVLVGLELHTPISLTGSLSLWFSVMLALSGLGLTLRALEARFGQLSLSRYHGLYEHSPALAIFFLLTGLASVGFPGTIGFVATEMLIDGAVESNLLLGGGVLFATAMNGIAIVRAYLLLFTGTRHVSSIDLKITSRERFSLLTLTVLILSAGIWPQPGVTTRYTTAEAILRHRARQVPTELTVQPHPSAETKH